MTRIYYISLWLYYQLYWWQESDLLLRKIGNPTSSREVMVRRHGNSWKRPPNQAQKMHILSHLTELLPQRSSYVAWWMMTHELHWRWLIHNYKSLCIWHMNVQSAWESYNLGLPNAFILIQCMNDNTQSQSTKLTPHHLIEIIHSFDYFVLLCWLLNPTIQELPGIEFTPPWNMHPCNFNWYQLIQKLC